MQIKLPMKNAYRLSLDDYNWPGQHCYWFHMDHRYDHSSSWQSIFEYFVVKNHWGTWIKPGMTCIDIGGHSGDTAIAMMSQCRATVLTVECNPTILPYLQFACDVNSHLGKFVVAKEAVTNTNAANLTFGDHSNGMCNGGILDNNWDPVTARQVAGMTGNTITVDGMTLESMVEKYLTKDDREHIGFIKTDTEGHDIEIIRSSRDFLVKYKPVLFTEWFFAYGPDDTNELFQAIDEAGYVPFYPETMEPADPSTRSEDLICIHKENL